MELCLTGLRKIVQTADGLETNVIPHHLRGLIPQEALEQLHECSDFDLRSLPVFAGERIEGEVLHAEFAAAFDYLTNALCTFAMSTGSHLATLFGPAAIAVHNDGDVARDRVKVVSGGGSAHGDADA